MLSFLPPPHPCGIATFVNQVEADIANIQLVKTSSMTWLVDQWHQVPALVGTGVTGSTLF